MSHARLSRPARRTRLAFALVACISLVAIAAALTPALAAEEPGAGGMEMTDEEMKQMMALGSPGPLHADLAKAAGGTWKTTTKLWEGGAEPITGEGTATFEIVLGGRFLVGHHRSSYRGMPFEGMSIDGYDNVKRQYVSYWFDNLSTGSMHLAGQPSADGRGIDLVGAMLDPSTGADLKVREEMRRDGDNKFTLTMYMLPPGGAPEMKVMEYTGVRQ